MLLASLLAETTNVVADAAHQGSGPGFLARFGLMLLPLLLMSATALAVMADRFLVCHREQINAGEFLAGVRNVMRRDNVVEAISICDATPGPVARLMKAAILAREGGRERIQEVVEEVGLVEVPRLEARLNVLATLAQVAPLVGLIGTLLGFIGVFGELQRAGAFAAPAQLFQPLWQSLYSAAGGLAIAVVCQVGYNHLVSRVNAIVLDMERAGTEALRLAGHGGGNGPAGGGEPGSGRGA